MKKRVAKKVVINMRIRRSDLALIDAAAKALGLSRSSLIRYAAEARARRVLALPAHQQSEAAK
jgi:uncharacterized protein (DUF1778 family)